MQRREIPFSPPDITQAEIDEVVDALRSGWITTGPKTKELERQVAARCGTLRAACLNSNTACAETTLRILGVGPGDEVVVPAYTYTATASVVAHVGARIVMVDCEPGRYTWDWDAVEAAITPRTKAIVPVDLFGIPADYERAFEAVEARRGLFEPSDNPVQRALGRVAVVADAAHSFGAAYRGAPVGSVADFTNFSFHAVKNLTTAEGGASTWREFPGVDSDELYRLYMLYSLHGQNKDALAKTKLGAWEYDIAGLWYKCNMTDVHAAIGLGQMRRYDAILARRREIVDHYDEAFAALPVELPAHASGDYESSRHLYVVRLFHKDGSPFSEGERNAAIERMAEAGVATNVHYKPLPMHSGYRRLGFSIDDYPNAFAQYSNAMTLPLHTCLGDEDVDYVRDTFAGVVRGLA